MAFSLVGFYIAAAAFRVWTLLLSAKHERALKRAGALEFHRATSLTLAAVHACFYAAVLVEGWARKPSLDGPARAGIALYVAGAATMVYAMRLLGRFWTIKLILAPDHRLQTHPLFRLLRHPNYFLGILPELAGLALALHAWLTLGLGLLVYAVPLTMRIRQEERMMRERFSFY